MSFDKHVFTQQLAKKHKIGYYDPQTGTLYCPNMRMFYIYTEETDERVCDREELEHHLKKMMENKTDGFFMTMYFDQEGDNREKEDYMQFMLQEKNSSFFSRLFGKSKEWIFQLEVRKGDKIYAKYISSFDELKKYILDYYDSEQTPDITGWEVLIEL